MSTTQASVAAREAITANLKDKFPNLFVLPETSAHLRVHTLIRDREASRADFVFYADQLMRSLIECAFDQLPYEQKDVTTPTNCTFNGLELAKEVIGVSIMRAGEAMEQALRCTIRGIKIGKILIQRDEASPAKQAKLFYSKLPDVTDLAVFLLDPMLASGSSAALAIQVLLERGVKEEDITFVNLIAAPEGIEALLGQYPRIKVVTTMIDSNLNSEKYIIPGIGDFGDRYFGT